MGGIFLTFLVYFSYDKSIQKDKNKQIIGISDIQKQKFRADSAKIMNCVQYVLVSTKSGWYEGCNKKQIFLLKNEVYKYGTTCSQNPEKRYKSRFYKSTNLEMIPQFYGDKAQCEIEEKRKLYHYPALPENIKRLENERLILPIGNCKTH